MKYTIGYFIGFLIAVLLHESYYDSKKECREFDGQEMCRTVHYGTWKETK
jgi:hypothetical protein